MPILYGLLILLLSACASTSTKVTDLCDPVGAERGGHEDGHQGRPGDFPEEMFRNCDNRSEIRTGYYRGHELGLREFCSEDHLRAAGQSMGSGGQEPVFEPQRFSICGVAKSESLKTAYVQGHRDGMKTFCEAPRAGQGGFSDGSVGKPQEKLGEKYKLCPADRRKKIYSNYEREYARGLAEWKQHQGEKGTGKAVPHDPHDPHFPPGMNYPASVARQACEKAGHKKTACETVTSAACVETGHSPVQCDIQTSYIAAVDACIRRGHKPSVCAAVKDRACIEAGREPANCQESPR